MARDRLRFKLLVVEVEGGRELFQSILGALRELPGPGPRRELEAPPTTARQRPRPRLRRKAPR